MIVLYTTGCPKCRVLHQKLREKGVNFTVFDDVDKMIDMGIMEAPLLEVDGEMKDFPSAVAWVNSL